MSYLSQATLLINNNGSAADAHRLVHSLFSRDGERDFVFAPTRPSHDGKAQFLIASKSKPDASAIFSVDTRDYAPSITAGAEVNFSLTALCAVGNSRVVDGKKKARTIDVVERALEKNARSDAPQNPGAVMRTAVFEWMQHQGQLHGFEVQPDGFLAWGYSKTRIERANGRAIVAPRINISGKLVVRDAAKFQQALVGGIGRGKSFGFGMLRLA